MEPPFRGVYPISCRLWPHRKPDDVYHLLCRALQINSFAGSAAENTKGFQDCSLNLGSGMVIATLTGGASRRFGMRGSDELGMKGFTERGF